MEWYFFSWNLLFYTSECHGHPDYSVVMQDYTFLFKEHQVFHIKDCITTYLDNLYWRIFKLILNTFIEWTPRCIVARWRIWRLKLSIDIARLFTKEVVRFMPPTNSIWDPPFPHRQRHLSSQMRSGIPFIYFLATCISCSETCTFYLSEVWLLHL